VLLSRKPGKTLIRIRNNGLAKTATDAIGLQSVMRDIVPIRSLGRQVRIGAGDTLR
jgi:hypothetical protein